MLGFSRRNGGGGGVGKAPIGVEHVFCLTPTDEDSHSATIIVLCFAIVCESVCVCVCVCVLAAHGLFLLCMFCGLTRI